MHVSSSTMVVRYCIVLQDVPMNFLHATYEPFPLSRNDLCHFTLKVYFFPKKDEMFFVSFGFFLGASFVVLVFLLEECCD